MGREGPQETLGPCSGVKPSLYPPLQGRGLHKHSERLALLSVLALVLPSFSPSISSVSQGGISLTEPGQWGTLPKAPHLQAHQQYMDW